MRVTLLPLLVFALTACHDEPDNKILFSGRVVAESTATPIPGAIVEMIQASILVPGHHLVGSDTTGADGLFSFEAGGGPGYAVPNCTVFEMHITAAGYAPATVYPGGPACDATEGSLDFGDIPISPMH